MSTGFNIWSGEFIKLDRVEEIAFIVLNRPEKANAYNQQMLDEIDKSIELIEAETDVAVVVFKSSSKKHFCAGADLNEVSERSIDDVLDLKSQRLFGRIGKMSIVTIAAISGDAVGGGLELALACDIRVSSDKSRFWFPETELGLIPAAGGIKRLPIIAGISLANEMILAGRKLTSNEALQSGLVSKIILDKTFDDEIIQLGFAICKRDQLANRVAKQILNNCVGLVNGTSMHNIAQAFLTLKKKCL